MKIATQEQINKLETYLKENNLTLSAEVITTYPEGKARTIARVTLMDITEEE